MTRLIALGVGAGLVAALLFAVAGTGSVPSVLLMYLSPLPILIVVLGWHHLLGLLALSVGALAVSYLLRPLAGTAFALGPALCAWLLGYAALMRLPVRTAASGAPRDSAPPAERWLSVGELLLAVGLVAALVAFSALVAATGGDHASYEESMRRLISALVRSESRAGRIDPSTSPLFGPEFVRAMTAVAPALVAAMLSLVLAVNLWLAAKVVAISGRLPRPWPDVPGTRMPTPAIVVAFGGAVLAQASGLIGVAGAALVGGMLMVFALQGLALIHYVSRRRPGRGLLLSSAYVLTIFLGYVFLPAFALLGIIDTALPLRRLLGGSGRPPPPNLT